MGKAESPNTKPTAMADNRTGIALAPARAKEMIDGAAAALPKPQPDADPIIAERESWSRKAPPVGTMPPPATVKGAIKTAAKALQGKSANVFLDLLGERLAYERTGTRLYQSLIAKLEAGSPDPGGPTRADIEEIHDEELQHFVLLKGAIESLGGDPTAMTPAADVIGTAGSGWVQALTDPRVTLTEALKVMLSVELTDNDAWQTLVDLAMGLGLDELAESFRQALQDEDEHLTVVRTWVALALSGQAGVELPAAAADEDTGPGIPAP